MALSILSKIQFAIGIIQFFTCTAIIGWAWSIGWGVLIVMKRFKKAPAAGAQGQQPQKQPEPGFYPV